MISWRQGVRYRGTEGKKGDSAIQDGVKSEVLVVLSKKDNLPSQFLTLPEASSL